MKISPELVKNITPREAIRLFHDYESAALSRAIRSSIEAHKIAIEDALRQLYDQIKHKLHYEYILDTLGVK